MARRSARRSRLSRARPRRRPPVRARSLRLRRTARLSLALPREIRPSVMRPLRISPMHSALPSAFPSAFPLASPSALVSASQSSRMLSRFLVHAVSVFDFVSDEESAVLDERKQRLEILHRTWGGDEGRWRARRSRHPARTPGPAGPPRGCRGRAPRAQGWPAAEMRRTRTRRLSTSWPIARMLQRSCTCPAPASVTTTTGMISASG